MDDRREAPAAGRPHQDAHAATASEIELRLSTLPTAFGEKIVMRIFDPEVLVRTSPSSASPPDDRDALGAHDRASPHGIILVTGPTGSGKTTTLYSTLKALATPEVNVCTIEDPIEMIEPAFNQMQVQPAIGVDFAERRAHAAAPGSRTSSWSARSATCETADMAIQAALTGHLVLSTLHTNDAPIGDHAPARPRRAALPDQLDAARRDGAAPGAHAVPALQGSRPIRPTTTTWARCHRAVASARSRRR